MVTLFCTRTNSNYDIGMHKLHTYIAMYVHHVVTIATPPENTTACRGSNVTISCGYVTATAFPVTWIINGTSFTQEEIVYGPLYQLNNPTTPMRVSLTVFSINATTTFQCMVQNTTSTSGTVTVIGMYVHRQYCTYVGILYGIDKVSKCVKEK